VTERLGQVCARTGLTPKQIRSYEKIRLLDDVQRTPGNQRLYTDAHVKRLLAIRRMRDAHLSFTDVRLALRLISGNAVGIDADGLARVLTLCTTIRMQLAVVEELTTVLRRRALDRGATRESITPPQSDRRVS
jgi:DNA-binding transcriptional MerR regulator